MPASTAVPDAPPSSSLALSLLRAGIALVFLIAVGVYTWATLGHVSLSLVVAAIFGGYMAMNIGANDVANNVGPAVGAKAVTMGKAIVIAAIFEAMGAIIAGGEVVGTVKSGIIDPAKISDTTTFIWVMMAALLAGALWLNLATVMGAPVSTTHSIVGGVLGAGVAAAGVGVADWGSLGRIAMSWLVSPVMGGVLAAGALYAIKRGITYQSDLWEAARRAVPVLIGAMAWAFSAYLLLKGFSKLVKLDFWTALLIGVVIGALVWREAYRRIGRLAPPEAGGDRDRVNQLFTAPLVFAAALLSFAHGSNDVSNAIGPLAAIHDALLSGGISAEAAIPLWIMVLGAVGLALGLVLYGAKLIRTVGSEITDIDPMRAYCIAMASAVTVILASQLGLPVSTTHVAIGAVFGVGFLREYLKANYGRILDEIRRHHAQQATEQHVVEAFLRDFDAASLADKSRMLKALKQQGKVGPTAISKAERKRLRKVHQKDLVKRSVFKRMIAAWLITVPASALMAAFIYFAIRGAMLP